MSNRVLGLDLGSDFLGWALLEETNGSVKSIVDIGNRIFTRAVEDKVPTPKNVKRRNMRLGRRVIQRRSRRKQRMLNYLVSLELLPKGIQGHTQPEITLNELGDPYELRVKALDRQLTPHEFGRILLHFVARRGFLSTKKQAAGDLIDDPDTIIFLNKLDNESADSKEEGSFKADIKEVYASINASGSRTLGEYLHKLAQGQCKRNRQHEGGHLRTERKMYQDELALIWIEQEQYFSHLPTDFMSKDQGILQIIFYQRPLKLKNNKVGTCSLEPKNYRAAMARLESQQFRYLQDINNLQYFKPNTGQWLRISHEDKKTLISYFEHNPRVTITALKKQLGLKRLNKTNLEAKNLKGNVTACEIRSVIGEQWDNYEEEKQADLVEDLLSIKKKSALKTRLISHWGMSKAKAFELCLLEFEPGHGSLSLKAQKKLLPFLKQGLIYSRNDHATGELGALQAAGYLDAEKEQQDFDKLGVPVKTSSPIFNRALHELRRVVNAIIKQYGKPDIIRIEMARDLEMNTKRYKENEFQHLKKRKENEKAVDAYKKLALGKFPSHNDKIKYRLFADQGHSCAYSNKTIMLSQVFTTQVEIGYILPFKESLDDSYMNKVLCFVSENRTKGDRTPKDAWSGDDDKWLQITQAINRWKGLDSKVKRFYQTEADLQKSDFIALQLNDTRYIAKIVLAYLQQLGCDVSVTNGYLVSQIRHQWGFNDLIRETDQKKRTDHRHHAIDAVVIAATSRQMYKKAVTQIERNKLNIERPYESIKDELAGQLQKTIVSYTSQKKLSGGLHEETGAGYIEKHGVLVYRKNLAPDFTLRNANSIVDETVKELVLAHLLKHGDDPKSAFAEGSFVYHKDNKTPIKRVRVLQSKTTKEKLEKSKFGIQDKSGKIFKYMSYGNMHHVEVVRNINTGKYQGVFITMMEASHRAKGIRSKLNPKGEKQAIIKRDHGSEWVFLMALHINDIVSIDGGEGQFFYRVQKLDSGSNRLVLRAHQASTLQDTKDELFLSISQDNFKRYSLKTHQINAIGIITDD